MQVDSKPPPGRPGRARPPALAWWPVIRGPGIARPGACLVHLVHLVAGRAWSWWPWAAQLVQLVADLVDQVAE